MPTVLENPDLVKLWAGWSIKLPAPASYDRNADGSWSAWGADWTIDVQIIEMSGNEHATAGTDVFRLNGRLVVGPPPSAVKTAAEGGGPTEACVRTTR